MNELQQAVLSMLQRKGPAPLNGLVAGLTGDGWDVNFSQVTSALRGLENDDKVTSSQVAGRKLWRTK